MESIHENEEHTPVVIQNKEHQGGSTTLTLSDAELHAHFFRVLSDPTRIRLLHLLLDAPAAYLNTPGLPALVRTRAGFS
jgi:hypothetical protein